MVEEHEAELRAAVAEGLLSLAEADALREEARRHARGPLRLLADRGRISEESLASIAARVATEGAADPDTTKSLPPAPTADPDATATLSPSRAGDAAEGAPAFPVTGWDRYQPVRFLGQGGMGIVFLARDLRLHREVAIKFVRGEDRARAARLITEARAQARVHHDRVCKVHEVGEVQGEVYIAMQFIDGEPLGTMAGRLSVEQKALLVREAALGVHEAHHQGIIHRDLKPANIMVSTGAGGDLTPYVMDFGIAHVAHEQSATLTGTVLGTPHYMSPEQARGEVSRLDRRTDVYSLGATLYALLTGEPPIPGDHALEVLDRIGREEPRPPRRLDPDIPVDLEAIVIKCLERDRSARYDSARALAEDLDRFLSGEPVLARPAGLGYRLRKWLWRHRRAAAAGAAAIIAVLVAVGFGVSAQRQAEQRERLARRFTELVERIESRARYSALSRLHDIRGDQAEIRARMGELEEEIRRAGPAGVGPGSYALGRGYLALGEDDKAREALERAWAAGFREPRVAYALALVTGHLYQGALREVDRIQQREQREEKRREIEREYRDPALAYLKQSGGAEVPSQAYVAALVAFYEGRLDDALKQLDAIGGGLPWFYEAPALRGDVLQARAQRRWDAGDRDGALADFEAGRRAYAAAAAVGESAPAVHEALGELEFAAMRMELYGQGDVKPRFERGEEAVRRALAAQPDDYAALTLSAHLYERFAEYRADSGAKVDDLLTKAVSAAERAVALAPAAPRARQVLGRSFYQWGSYRQDHGEDPRAELQKAAAIFAGMSGAERDYDAQLYLGLVYQTWADYEDQSGKDGLEKRNRAIDAYLAATAIDPRQVPAWVNLGTTYFTRAAAPHIPDPDGDLARAEGAFLKANALNPKHVVPHYYLGEVHGRMADRLHDKGGDARPMFSRAIEDYRRGLAINPSMWHLHSGVGLGLLDLAREAWDHGESPDSLLVDAISALEKAVAAAPDQGLAQVNLAEVLLRRARFQVARGEDATSSAAAALAAAQRAAALQPGLSATEAKVRVFLAGLDLERRRDPREQLAAAGSAAERALRQNPRSAVAHLALAEMRGLAARAEAGRGGAPGEPFVRAREAFEEAIDLSADLDARLAFGRFCATWALAEQRAGRDPGPPLARGLELSNHLLSARPAWAEARVVRASLLVIQARAAGDATQQREIRARAAEDFTKALAENRNLERAFGREAAEARALAAAP